MSESELENEPTEAPKPQCCTGTQIAKVVALVVVIAAGINAIQRATTPRATDQSTPTHNAVKNRPTETSAKSKHVEKKSEDKSTPAEKPTAPTDEDYRKLVIGTWQDEYKGKRVMTVHEDGTAVMVVEPSGVGALFAAKMMFNMTWSIEDGRLKKKTTGGEPATKVNLILKTMGDSVDEPILELTDERLLLLDGDGKNKYDWRRVKNSDDDENGSKQ